MGKGSSANKAAPVAKTTNAPSLWRTTPPSSRFIFLLAVFFVFASFGFTNDSTNMGREPALRYAVSVVLSGLFAVGYATAGVTLRSKAWKVCVPWFVLQFLSMGWLVNRFPDAPPHIQLNAAETAALNNRLVFDGVAIIVCVTLGYVGFVYVSVSEGRRHLKSQLEKASLERNGRRA